MINKLLAECTSICKEDYHEDDQAEALKAHPTRLETVKRVNRAKEITFPGASGTEIESSTLEWLEQWELITRYIIVNTFDQNKSVRYLGVFFSLDLESTSANNAGWMAQLRVLNAKCADSNKRISRSCPTRHQKVYCINAVINAQLKFPLQVANIPDLVLDK